MCVGGAAPYLNVLMKPTGLDGGSRRPVGRGTTKRGSFGMHHRERRPPTPTPT